MTPHIQRLLSCIEKLGEQKMVHGDIRERNILADDKGDFKLIDSDWAGYQEKVFYPWDKLRSYIETTCGRLPSGRIFMYMINIWWAHCLTNSREMWEIAWISFMKNTAQMIKTTPWEIFIVNVPVRET